MLCEMFATLGLEGGGSSEEKAVGLNDVSPEDFGMLVHYYNDFPSVILPNRSTRLGELTRWTGPEGFLSALPRFNTGKG